MFSNKWSKIIGWIVGSIILVFVIGVLVLYFWLSTKWSDFYTEDEMQLIASEVSSTESLPQNFYLAYDHIFPEQINRTLKKMSLQVVLYSIFNRDDKLTNLKQCNCINTARFFKNKVPQKYHSWSFYIIAHGIEKYTTEAKCFDFNFNKLGVRNIAQSQFSKPIEQLTVEESSLLIQQLLIPNYNNAYRKSGENASDSFLVGVWVHEKDSLSVLTFKDSLCFFEYNSEISEGDMYTFNLTDELPKFINEAEKSDFLVLTSKTDTMYYEILNHNDTILSLMHFPTGRFHLYHRD